MMGCFFGPMRSRMLPVMRSKMGCAASAGRKSLFLQCFVGFVSAAVIATVPANMQRPPGVTCWKGGIFQEKFGLWPVDLHPGFRRVWGLHLWVFQVAGLKISMERPKTRDLEKFQNIFALARPSSFLFFGDAPGFRQKRVFENRQIFAETTENVVPNCRGSKTHFGALRFRNKPC